MILVVADELRYGFYEGEILGARYIVPLLGIWAGYLAEFLAYASKIGPLQLFSGYFGTTSGMLQDDYALLLDHV